MVIDTSGSMEGASIRQAREAVGLAIGRLGQHERFNVIQFNDAAESLFPRSMPGSAWYRGQAENYVRHLVATGGTNMQPALEAALAGPAEEGRLRQVVFVTDGAVANEDALFGLIARRLGDSRLFSVGIGPAPNRYFMEGAARLGRGATVQVSDLNTLQARMQQLFDKLEHPALTDIRISLPDGSDLLAGQAPVPDLYLGDPVVVYGGGRHAGGLGETPRVSKFQVGGIVKVTTNEDGELILEEIEEDQPLEEAPGV